MSAWVICPKRSNKKVSLEVCFGVCETRKGCKKLIEVPEAEANIVLAKLNKLPAPQGGVEIDGVIVEPAEEIGKDPEEASKLIAKALFIKDDIEGKFWEMGEVLYVIFKKQYYVDAGYRDWRTFCNNVLDVRWRTATYLKDIYEKFSELGVDEILRKGIGWSKLKELLPVVNAQNVNHWIELARGKKNSVQVLNAMVRYALGKIPKEEADRVPQIVAFRLLEEQVENVKRALEIARRLTGSDSRAYQLEMICAEFRATYDDDGERQKAKVVASLLRKIEVTMKVKFNGEVIDQGTGEIIA